LSCTISQIEDMQLEILTPEQKIYSGNVYGIQLPGIEGSFEILEKHAPMISSLGAGKMKILKDKNNTELYEITGGFAEVINNKVSVLIEDATALG
jgi:F-type H+-transporting ATPase subunit epsilon